MEKIPLSRGKFAIVDREDYDRIMSMGKWTFHNAGYAYRWDRSASPQKCLLMHRVVIGTPKGLDTDHINRDKLDNRRSNLRAVSRSANSLNKITKGIESSTRWSGFEIRITANGTRVYIGRFKDREEAMSISRDIKQQLLEAII